MKILSNKNFFEPRARLLLQLGDKLIKNENIALLELIKNAYDADSRKVKVQLDRITSKKEGIIDIIDDGEGMDMEIIENVWLEPGSDYKAQLLASNTRTKKFNRLPIGEKGIGRFGVHKLGNKIELITRKEGKNEVVVKIDWNNFSSHKYLKDAKFEVYERTPEYFVRTRTGTRIIISDLRSDWDRKMIRDLYKSVFTLNSPFQKPGKFSVELDIDNKKLIDDLPQWSDIKNFALWHFKCTLSGNQVKSFLYEFTPWESMDEIKPKTISEEDEFAKNNSTITTLDWQNSKDEIVINLNRNYGLDGDIKTIGDIEFEGYVFDRDKLTLGLSEQQGISLLTEYLDEQGGVRVYRDNIRINEYGEKGNDWLGLDIRRINYPAKRISTNIILGVIDLKVDQSKALIEKTNREGFIENDAFHDFTAAILYIIQLIETLRKLDKDLIRNKYNPTIKEEPVLFHLGELKKLVDKEISDEDLKFKINQHLAKIEQDYNEINEILLASAGVGLTFGVGIHEVQKVIEELSIAIRKEEVSEKIISLVIHLDKLVENYGDLLRQNENEEQDVGKIINGTLFNVEYRIAAHEIEVIKKYTKFKGPRTVKCSKRLILGSLMNIIDNSIYWLERKYFKEKEIDSSYRKKILVDLIENKDGFVEILVADNGTGFNLPTSQLTKPFISSKPGGMGLGLHIVSEVMKVQNGSLVFPSKNDYDIPLEFNEGAIVVLKLKTL
jgi:signal transduction histidine kinase